MGWLDTVKSWFTPESTQAEIGIPFKYQYPKAEFPEWEPPPAQYDYPTLEPWETVSLPAPEYGESLWDKFKSGVKTVYQEAKEIAPDVGSFYAQIQGIKKPVDNTALIVRETPRAEIPRQDFVVSTPYQRPTSGTQPTAKPGIAGLSVPLILIGAGLVFLMLKKR
ncbi:hypothetical protein ES703_10215 [subsurface metagenome]